MKCSKSIIFLFSLAANLLHAQVSFLPLDENVGFKPSATYVSADKQILAVQAVTGIGFRQATVKLNKWNGQFWVNYPGFSAEQFLISEQNRISVIMHKGEYFIAGSFSNYDRSKVGIVRWTGNAWTTVAGGIESDYLIHKEISVNEMLSFNNELFVCGEFNVANGKPVHNFVVLRGNDWINIETNKGKVSDLELHNDTLYAAGLFNQIDGKPANNLAAHYAGNWFPVNGPSSNEVKGISAYKNELVAITVDQVFLRNGITWQLLGNQWEYKVEQLGNATEFEGKFYLAGSFINPIGKKVHLLVWDGAKWQAVIFDKDASPQGEKLYYIHKKDQELIFSGNLKGLFGQEVNHLVRLFPGRTIVKGKVFEDQNNDCKFNSGETPMANAILSVNDSFYSSTDAEGNYSLVLDKNASSVIKVFPGMGHEITCRSDQFALTTTEKDSMVKLDFPFSLVPGPEIPDYNISSASGFKARHGYLVHYTVNCSSPLKNYPLELKLDFDEQLILTESGIAPNGQLNNQLSWIMNENGTIELAFLVDHSQFTPGDSLRFVLKGYPTGISGWTSELKELRQIVVSAFDPNEKQCDKTEMRQDDEKLEYHIEFQNLGNDSAVNINVVDTIDPSLPIQFIQMKAYSERHKGNVTFKVRNRAIIWSFKDIYLPSKSMTDDHLSSGHISYVTALDSGIDVGQVISNKALIYFDYQDPVITNTVKTKIIESDAKPGTHPVSGNLMIFPNPTSDGSATIALSSNLIQQITVHDLTGRFLLSKSSLFPVSEISIDLNTLAPGVYIVNVNHTTGSVSGILIVNP